MNIQGKKVMVQIGTNDGADEFNALCRGLRASKIILVEPNTILNPFIIHNYSDIDNVFIENVAITDVNKGTVLLYLPTQLVDEEKTKKDIRYATGHFSLFVPKEWYGEVTTIGKAIECPSMTFEELCKKYNITDIEFLQIDTEGYDATILKSIDFTKHNIKTIKYESTNNWQTESIVPFLESKGYVLTKIDELDVLATKF